MFLNQINYDDILKAINEYKEENIPINNRRAKKYLLIFKGKEYYPKPLTEIACDLNNIDVHIDGTNAKECLEKNGFELFYYGKFRECLEKKYTNEKTVRTYLADLKKAIKAIKTLQNYREKQISDILNDIINNKISKELFLKALEKFGSEDTSLVNSIKIKA